MSTRKKVAIPETAPSDLPLHLKYRPATFKEVLGQDSVVKSIQATLAAKSRPHVYLFTGGSGTGKTTLARILTQEFHVDAANIVEVDAGSSGGIDVMRDVMAPLRYQGFGDAPNKAIIVDECHMLSKQAWSSLLKTIEEPPEHVFFFFCTTEAGKVPENIKTRCQSYNLRQVKYEDIMDLLDMVCEEEGYKTPERFLAMVAQACGGSPRMALVMLAQVYDAEDEDEVSRLLETPLDNKEVIDLCRQLIKNDLTWKRLVEVLKSMPEMPAESVRIVIVAYLSACAMGARSEDDAVRILDLMEPFGKPFATSDKMAPLLLAFGRVIFP